MPRYSAGGRSTGAGSTTLPVGSIYSGAAGPTKIVEIGVFNTTAVAAAIKLVRLTSTGTQGAGLTEAPHENDASGAVATAFDTHSAAPTLGNDLGYRASLGAAIGAGVIWTFDNGGLRIAPGVANGVGIIVASGTGQILDWYVVWDE